MFRKVCSGFGCTDTQVKLEQEKHQREVAEERLLHVEKLRSDLVVDLAQEKKRNGLLEEELRAEAEKVSQLHTWSKLLPMTNLGIWLAMKLLHR